MITRTSGIGGTDRTATPSVDSAQQGIRRHIPALDGLRGLALVGVLLYHAGHLRGGFLGVDLFFVLSGFLITGLLIAEYREAGTIDLRRFWIRRFRRLMPASLTMLVVVALVAGVLDLGGRSTLRGDGLSTLFYVANWHALLTDQTYWQQFASPSLLDHTWSLAIEEQFYLVWPLVLWAMFRFTRASLKALLGLCLVLAAASELALVVLYQPGESDRSYLGTDTRGAAILLGAALATGLAMRGHAVSVLARRALAIAGLVAMAALATAWFVAEGRGPFLYRGGFLLTEIAVLTVLAAVAQPQGGILSRVLSVYPLRWLGMVSYGAYLWHWPIYLYLNPDRVGFDDWPLTVLRISASLIVAALSSTLVEQPIRRSGLPKGVSARLVVPVSFVLAAAIIVTTTSGVVPEPDPMAGAPDADVGLLEAPKGAPRIMVVGDSVAFSLAKLMAGLTGPGGVGGSVVNRSFPSCALTAGDVGTRNSVSLKESTVDCSSTWRTDVERLKPTASIILLGGGTKAQINAAGSWQDACQPGWDRTFAEQLGKGIADLVSGGGRVVVLTTPHYASPQDPAEGSSRVECLNRAIGDAVGSQPRATLVDLNAWLCPGGVCRKTQDDGMALRKDGLHFADPGGKSVAEWVASQLPKDR